MTTDDIISIVIVTFRRPIARKRCLVSIEKQQYSAREIVVVNNGGDEETSRLMKEFFPGCILIEQKINIGVAEGRNVGIKAASGEYCLILDDDAELRDTDALGKVNDKLLKAT